MMGVVVVKCTKHVGGVSVNIGMPRVESKYDRITEKILFRSGEGLGVLGGKAYGIFELYLVCPLPCRPSPSEPYNKRASAKVRLA